MDRVLRRVALVFTLFVAAGVGVALAERVGQGRVYAMPASGVLAVTNTQANAVWRPVSLSVRCPDVAERTVAISRRTGGFEYELASVTDEGQLFIYEFDVNYWFVESNVLVVSVVPACTGIVEVIYE